MLTPNFSVTQLIGTPSILTITDTSTGSDVLIASRIVYLQKADGTYLVPTGTTTDYIAWPYADISIDIDVLNVDYALNVRVDWLDVGGAALYTKTIPTDFTLYGQQFLYLLTRMQTSNPLLINNKNFYSSKIKLICSLDEANNAIFFAGDIVAAQSCLDRATYLEDNQTTLFV